MKRSVLVVGVSATLAMLMIAWSIGRVQGQLEQVNAQDKVLFVSASQANYHESNKGVSMAVIWGDSDKGAHATFTKFAPGVDNGMHSHTNDIWIVGIKGEMCIRDSFTGANTSRGVSQPVFSHLRVTTKAIRSSGCFDRSLVSSCSRAFGTSARERWLQAGQA